MERNFEHRQRSVYCSDKKMSRADVIDMTEKLKKDCPWLKTCLRRMDVANIEELHELTDIITKK